MGEAKPSQHAGFVEICVAVCRPEFMARSSQLYYFMVSLVPRGLAWWVQDTHLGTMTAGRLDLCGQGQGDLPCSVGKHSRGSPQDWDPNPPALGLACGSGSCLALGPASPSG